MHCPLIDRGRNSLFQISFIMVISKVLLLLPILRGCNGQRFGISSAVTFTNKIIPNILHALSFDHENVVFSPFGLSSSLAMILEGLDKKLAQDMIDTLNLENPSNAKQTLRLGFKALLEEFEKEKNSQDPAGSYNSAFVQSSIPLLPEYKAILENFYKCLISYNETTNSTDLQLNLHSDTGVMSHWKDFDKLAVYTYLTHQSSAPFITHKGTSIDVPMIPQVGTFRVGYIHKLNSQAVDINLETKRASLLLIMPDYRGAIKEVLAKMLTENLAALSSSLKLIETEVSFPQFVILNNYLDLGAIIQKLGLKSIFNKGPVRSITQNAYFATSFVSVNSIGSTNTTLAKKPDSRRKREAANTIVFNKPFIFFLLHKPSGASLLAGIVQSPSQVP